MRLLPSLLVFTLLGAQAAFGVDLANHVCPSLSTEGNRLVTGIQTLQGSLKKGAECESIDKKLGTINGVISKPEWSTFKGLLSGDDVESLEPEQIDSLTTLASDAANALTQTISLLNGAGRDCVAPENKPSFLGVLSGVTKEVSTLVGQATGPYGMAISLGGNILSNAISGIDSFFKSGKAYDFSNKDEEVLFMNQFCSFVETKKDVIDFVMMDERVNDLEYLEKYLGKKLESAFANCPECVAYDKAFKSKLAADKIVAKIVKDVDIISNIDGKTETISRCSEMSRAVHAPESDFEALMSLYDNYENPMMSVNDGAVIEDTLKARSVFKEIFPTLSECWRMDQPKIEEISIKFNNIMRDDILRMNKTVFDQQLSTIKFLANKKYVDPLGDYTANSLERKAWAAKEKLKVAKRLAEANREVDLSHVRELHEDLENRISGFLMPQYLNFLINKNKSSLKYFGKDFYRFRKATLREYSRKLNKPLNSLEDVVRELKANKNIDGRVFISKYRRTFDKLDTALSQRKAIARYCEYIAYTSTLNSGSQYACEVRVDEIARSFKVFDRNAAEFKALADYNKWASENLDIQSSRVRDYADLIRQWNSKGDSRWLKKGEAAKPKVKSIEERIELSDN